MTTVLARRAAQCRALRHWPVLCVGKHGLPAAVLASRAASSSPASEPQASGVRAASGRSGWGRFVEWAYRIFGGAAYPANTDFNNCGLDMGLTLPRGDLLRRDDIVENSREHRMQLYGAALYWHLASTPGSDLKTADPDMLRGKDVLEVACMRGGGARYLKEVAGPRLYVATDNVDAHIAQCRERFPDLEGLRFQLADAEALPDALPSDSFDFVLCVQAVSNFGNLSAFAEGVMHVLRPDGRLILADAMSRERMKNIMDALQDAGLIVDVTYDLGRYVHAVGLCIVPKGVGYMRIVAHKPGAGST